MSFSKRFAHESGRHGRTLASRDKHREPATAGLHHDGCGFGTMDGVGGDRKPRWSGACWFGRSSRHNSWSGPQESGSARPRNTCVCSVRAKPYRCRSGCLGGSVWTTFSVPSSVTSRTWTGSCARSDTSFAAAFAVCSVADSKSVFGLSQRTLNFGIWMLLTTSATNCRPQTKWAPPTKDGRARSQRRRPPRSRGRSRQPRPSRRSVGSSRTALRPEP